MAVAVEGEVNLVEVVTLVGAVASTAAVAEDSVAVAVVALAEHRTSQGGLRASVAEVCHLHLELAGHR